MGLLDKEVIWSNLRRGPLLDKERLLERGF